MMTDREIIQGLIDRDNHITEHFFYAKCRPLLTAIMRLVFNYPVEYNNHNYISDEELAAYLDGNVREEEMAHILSSLGDNPEVSEILALSPEIDQMVTEEKNRLDVFRKAWKASGNYMVTASKVAGGYNPQPINVEDIDLDANLEELTEAIAENTHDIWARTRMDEGWTYGSVRNDELKQHPDLVPYSQLPDSEKKYDRLMAMNTLRLVHRLGFDIINRKNH